MWFAIKPKPIYSSPNYHKVIERKFASLQKKYPYQPKFEIEALNWSRTRYHYVGFGHGKKRLHRPCMHISGSAALSSKIFPSHFFSLVIYRPSANTVKRRPSSQWTFLMPFFLQRRGRANADHNTEEFYQYFMCNAVFFWFGSKKLLRTPFFFTLLFLNAGEWQVKVGIRAFIIHVLLHHVESIKEQIEENVQTAMRMRL